MEFAVPFMCLIDFKGFRLIASSKLPINNSTLVYGSADGGRTQLIQHVSQLSVTLRALPKPDMAAAPQRIGFRLVNDLEEG